MSWRIAGITFLGATGVEMNMYCDEATEVSITKPRRYSRVSSTWVVSIVVAERQTVVEEQDSQWPTQFGYVLVIWQ